MPTKHQHAKSLEITDAELRADIRRLGSQLGKTLVRQHGPELLKIVERVRSLSRDLRQTKSDPTTSDQLAETLKDADLERAMQLVRAFTVYFHLANVIEQVHRIEDHHAKGERNHRLFDQTVDWLVGSGISPDAVGELVNRAQLKPVFTAHPTEASRRTILEKLAEIARVTEQRGDVRRTDSDRERIDRRVDELIEAIWQTDEIRSERPDPLDEARFVHLLPRSDCARGHSSPSRRRCRRYEGDRERP